MKFAAFDLEIAKLLPEQVDDLKAHAPLGISCAAVALSDEREPRVWQGAPQMTSAACQEMVGDLQQLAASGYNLLTWNGCSFDFYVLAQESGLLNECAELALAHVDLMLTVTFTKGYYLGLDKALKGAGLVGKRSSVTLRDGSIHEAEADEVDGRYHRLAFGEQTMVLQGTAEAFERAARRRRGQREMSVSQMRMKSVSSSVTISPVASTPSMQQLSSTQR
jgi:hypothetical protein